jgi:cytochrome c553
MNKLILALSCTAALMVSASAFASGDTARGAELAKKYNCASCHGAD